MDDFPIAWLMGGAGFGLGLVFGYVARSLRFCTLSAIESAYLGHHWIQARMWALAVGVAVIGTHGLHVGGLIDLTGSFHLMPRIHWSGPILGGLMFGMGMAAVGTCGFGALLRAAGGDLRALVVVLVLAISAYVAMSGLLAEIRVGLVALTTPDLPDGFDASPAGLIAWIGGAETEDLRWPVALICGGLLLLWSVAPSELRTTPSTMVAGVTVGLIITAGWFVTGYLGNDPFDPQMLGSFGFAGPAGESLMYLMTFSGAAITFGIGGIFGTALGGFIAAKRKREFRVDGFDDTHEMRRHLCGAVLMGVGGVIGMGCTVGQGLSGVSTLAVPSFLALGAIVLGAVIGLEWLMRDDPLTAVWGRLSGRTEDVE